MDTKQKTLKNPDVKRRGRTRINIGYVKEKNRRKQIGVKRKGGFKKKARELAILSGVETFVLLHDQETGETDVSWSKNTTASSFMNHLANISKEFLITQGVIVIEI